MKTINDDLIADLGRKAAMSPRRRRHHNLHASDGDPCQRLLNFLWHDSYIRPHRHAADPKEETLIALRGDMGCIRFDADGRIIDRTICLRADIARLSLSGPASGTRSWANRIGRIARNKRRARSTRLRLRNWHHGQPMKEPTQPPLTSDLRNACSTSRSVIS